MNIKLTGHHVEVTDALRDYVHEKFAKLKRHFDNVVDTEVILSVEKVQHKAEADIRLGGGGGRVFAEAVADDMYPAIDLLVDKLDRQILKHKEKHVEQRRQGNDQKAGS